MLSCGLIQRQSDFRHCRPEIEAARWASRVRLGAGEGARLPLHQHDVFLDRQLQLEIQLDSYGADQVLVVAVVDLSGGVSKEHCRDAGIEGPLAVSLAEWKRDRSLHPELCEAKGVVVAGRVLVVVMET